MKRYNPSEIEPKWQQRWDETKLYAARDDDPRDKFYYLVEFPYPSGDGLHVGHVRSYTALDIMARYKRMQGYNVLYPIGYDEFGLPTENYAIKHKIAPQAATARNVATFERQLRALGLGFDWDRQVHTSDPKYYRWTQWIFLQLYKRGLAYQAELPINWCPFEKTGLANEEVVNGVHERCGTPVEKKLLKQWVLRITRYADRLAEDLKTVDYLDRISSQQINWIGRSEGAEIEFTVGGEHETKDSLKFTPELTRLIQAGTKTSTIRLEPKQLVEGDYAKLITRISKDEVQAFAVAKITRVETAKLKDVPLEQEGHEPYASQDEKLKDFQKFYGTTVTDETEFTTYHFEVVAPIVTVYTTRPDTLAGATFLVLAPEHAAVRTITTADQRAEVEAYLKKTQSESEVARQETDRPKTGVWTGAIAKNPITGRDMPIWVADYVLASYGTGAIMAVPAHDERDFAFAKAMNQQFLEAEGPEYLASRPAPYITIAPVIEPIAGTPHGDDHEKEAIVAVVHNPKTNETLLLDWGPRHSNWGGMLFIGGGVEPGEDLVKAAEREIAEETGYTRVKFVRQTEVPVNNYYYSNVKHRHDKARMYGLLFELVDETQVATNMDEGEKNKFTVTWVPDDEVFSTVNDGGHEIIYRMLMREEAFPGEGVLIHSGQFDGLVGIEAKRAITKWLFDQGIGRGATKYKLRDWIFSRQHYWGEPIPIVHCAVCGAVPVPEDRLPVELPAVKSYEPTDTGESPLAAIADWVNITCPQCDGPAKRETDTMPNWAGSSWYWLRYTDPHNDMVFADSAKLAYWTPVDLYNGGMEHTTLHLLYSRFWHKFLYDEGLVPTPEPYARRRSHGMILGPDNVKMSKSRGNVINPDKVVDEYGADTLRLYEMFMGPFDEQTAWSDERLNGVSRFLYRVWTLAQDLLAAPGATTAAPSGDQGAFEAEIDRAVHKTLKKVHHDIEGMQFNTAVSAFMELINTLTKAETKARLLLPESAGLRQRSLRTLVLMLAPFAPHVAEELWHDLGESDSVHVAGWPQYDPELIKDDIVTIVVQVNGKVRANILATPETTEAELTELARADANVVKYLEGATIVKTIVVPRKLVNFVVKP